MGHWTKVCIVASKSHKTYEAKRDIQSFEQFNDDIQSLVKEWPFLKYGFVLVNDDLVFLADLKGVRGMDFLELATDIGVKTTYNILLSWWDEDNNGDFEAYDHSYEEWKKADAKIDQERKDKFAKGASIRCDKCEILCPIAGSIHFQTSTRIVGLCKNCADTYRELADEHFKSFMLRD